MLLSVQVLCDEDTRLWIKKMCWIEINKVNHDQFLKICFSCFGLFFQCLVLPLNQYPLIEASCFPLTLKYSSSLTVSICFDSYTAVTDIKNQTMNIFNHVANIFPLLTIKAHHY